MSEIEYTFNNCDHEGHNTRAVPDVPELVRYDLTFDMPFGEGADMSEVEDGEYVLHSQAAEIIEAERAGKEKAILEYNEIFKTAEGWKERAKAAEARLAAMEEMK